MTSQLLGVATTNAQINEPMAVPEPQSSEVPPMTAAAIACKVRKGPPAAGSADANWQVLMIPAAAAQPPAIMKLYTLTRSVRIPISRAPTMLLPVAMVLEPKVVLFNTHAIAATAQAVPNKGANALRLCQDQRESPRGSYRLSPKISLNGSCTSGTIG